MTLRGSLLAAASLLMLGVSPAFAAGAVGAWNGNTFQIDRPNVVGRSDIILAAPNNQPSQSMPLGNGRLGVAVWSQNGFTAQLNRSDTMPKRLSPGQVLIPGLSRLTTAANYQGRLDLYNGEFRESGGGMTATAYVQPDTDTLVIDVTGANPTEMQTAAIQLWSGRSPTASVVNNTVGVLAETWKDSAASYPQTPPNNLPSGASDVTFGSLSAITAVGRNVSVTTTPLSATVTFLPNVDGTFRVVVGAPHYNRTQTVASLAIASLGDAVLPPQGGQTIPEHQTDWHNFWNRVGLIKLASQTGDGEYMENLRNLYLYATEASSKDNLPGTQAGIADLFSFSQDYYQWDPGAVWHWNIRMQVAANMAAGLPDLNMPYFNLYNNNLSNLQQWTKTEMGDRPGICLPETMRFNGQGVEQEPYGYFYNCVSYALSHEPYSNARTLSTGPEVAHFVWLQYLQTHDIGFLQRYYPLMSESARFLLAYQHMGADKLYHTQPTNAHETQHDVKDSTTDIAAMKTLFTEVQSAAQVLSIDTTLKSSAAAALPLIPDYPRTAPGGTTLLPKSDDAAGKTVIGYSYIPDAPLENVENIGLEPVWPYDQIGDASPDFKLAQRTYQNRPFVLTNDWSFDPIDAARLDVAEDVRTNLVRLTQQYQIFPNGFAGWDASNMTEPYIEQIGIVAITLPESLVQDYDGTIRIAPATPSEWDYDGTVFVRDNTKVNVQVRKGAPELVVIEPGSSATLTVRNPWPGAKVTVANGSASPTTMKGATLTLPPVGTLPIVLQKAGAAPLSAQIISGTPATAVRYLLGGEPQIGVSKP